ncbi:hypothetical protein [Agromyces sp. Soil535]|uniref:hypothetical protein n=1 Tax=Agromyces sp. Soil535 TaxID=1736390 RepID=UPI00070220FB|nr:hypothetical protein [Agromyces sp. Soil535]KRE25019.1 hypothetical protein ASG80_22315 [Agromyces sp. Soil535]
MSTDDETHDSAAGEPQGPMDAADAGVSAEAAGAASDDVRATLAEIESQPLADRAPGYQDLADRLRVELEESDPSRGPN